MSSATRTNVHRDLERLDARSSSGLLLRNCGCGRKIAVGHDCAKCATNKKAAILRKGECNRSNAGGVPEIVYDVLRTPGKALDPFVRASMEERLSADLSSVRVHSDSQAGESTHAIESLGYAVGNHLVLRPALADPQTPVGRYLLAHELAHVVQQAKSRDGLRAQSEGGLTVSDDAALEQAADRAAMNALSPTSTPTRIDGASSGVFVQRFEASEANEISNLQSVVDTARKIATDTGVGDVMRWGRFTAGAGGQGAIEAMAPQELTSTQTLSDRYLFTCRCGLIDMRHFYQLMYVGLFPMQGGNRGATKMGRGHELTGEATSRFAAEDTTSNAMGALFGSERSLVESQSGFIDDLQAMLSQCSPVDFLRLTPADQKAIVDYYSARNPDGTPKNANEAATPTVLPISACDEAAPVGPPNRTFPFDVVPDDPDRKTISRR